MIGIRRQRGQVPGESRRSRLQVELGGQPLTGEMQLMLAVLEDVLRSLVSEPDTPIRSRKRVRDLAWVRSRGRESPFSFENVCDVLGIDADRLRRRVFAAVQTELAQTE
jgi:hypothetical protein